MCHLAHTHGTSQPRTAFKGMQRTQRLPARAKIGGVCAPLPQCGTELRQQLKGLLFKYREQVNVKPVNGLDTIILWLQSWQYFQLRHRDDRLGEVLIQNGLQRSQMFRVGRFEKPGSKLM